MKRAVFIIVGLLLISQCKEQETLEFDRKAMLTALATDLILPSYTDLKNATNILVATTAVKKEYGIDATGLAELRKDWKNVLFQWEKCAPFNFGPIDKHAMVTAMHNWPVHTEGIEQLIVEYNGEEKYLAQFGTNQKGLSAIEYLLFSSNPIHRFESHNRRAVLHELAKELHDFASLIVWEWQENGYWDVFTSRIDNKSDGSLTLLANELVYLLDLVEKRKLANPLGLNSGEEPDSLLVQLPYSPHALEAIHWNIQAAKETYSGRNGNGLQSYLVFVAQNSALDQDIVRAFELVEEKILVLQGQSLQKRIVYDSEKVRELHDAIAVLRRLIQVDLISRLNLFLIFTDNDGD